MRIFGVIILSLVFSFLLTTLCFWLVTLLLPYLGLTFEFTWLRSLGALGNLYDNQVDIWQVIEGAEKSVSLSFELLDNGRRQAEFLIISYFQHFVKTFG